ncbi:MAG: Clp1/GlmU family protein [Candidatus Nezhaarchaeales archaeon]
MALSGKTEDIAGYYIVEGPLRIKLIEGQLELTGKSLSINEEVVIPSAKATLMESPNGAKVEFRGGGAAIKLESSTIPREWIDFINSMPRKTYTVFTLGYIDSGKTFFVTYTANKLLAQELKVSIVDCDIGQSDIGPPTTIGLGVLNRQVAFLDEVHPISAYCVGSTSPAGHLLPMVVGTTKLVNDAKNMGGIVLIDTPGMVYGGPARAYQLYTVEAIKPDVIVAFQRGDELKHLTKQFKALGYEVVELPASPWVKQRDRGDRRLLRERAFYNYFSRKGMMKHTISLEKTAIIGSFIGSGCEASQEVIQVIESMANCKVDYCEISQDSAIVILSERPKNRDSYAKIRSAFTDKTVKTIVKGFEQGLVVGLMGEKGKFLDIGVMKELDVKNRRATITTPLRSIEEVKAIKLGCVRLNDEYREIERLEPGYI